MHHLAFSILRFKTQTFSNNIKPCMKDNKMPRADSDIQKELINWFNDAEKIVIAGIGNPIRSDDYVGTRIIHNLEGKVPKNVLLIECETVPESYILEIEEFKPSHVLLIDAALMQLKPGQARLLSPEEIPSFSTISSHTLPLRIFCEYISKSTKAKIALLLIEPKNVEFGEDLTIEVQRAAEEITSLIQKLLQN